MDTDPPGRRDLLFWGVLLVALGGQLVAVTLLLHRVGVAVPLAYGLGTTLRGILLPLAGALVIRAVVAILRGLAPREAILSVTVGWWELLLVVGAYFLLAEAYMWGKVFVPAINPRLFDGVLARIDRTLCFGVNPNVALLTIFEGSPPAAVALDRFYGAFVPSMLAVTAWFSTGRPARRKGFFLAVALVWSAGLWLYLTVPARGPVYADSALWREVAAVFPVAAAAQRMLLGNFRNVMAFLGGAAVPVSPVLGIAAMPSLHVAAQALFFWWCVRLKTRWRTVFLVTTGLTVLGAVATGWHWAVDCWVGAALGLAAAEAGWRVTLRFEEGGAPDSS